MGCTASVAAAPEQRPFGAADSPNTAAAKRTASTDATDNPKSAIRAGPSGKGPKKGVSFRKKETELLGPRKVGDPSAPGKNDAPAPSGPPPPADASAQPSHPQSSHTQHGHRDADSGGAPAKAVEGGSAEPVAVARVDGGQTAPSPTAAEVPQAEELSAEVGDEGGASAATASAGDTAPPESDPVFDEPAHWPGEKLLEKSDVNKRGNLKHFGVRQSVERDMDARAATQNLFKKSTGVVPKVFVESVFSTYDLNGDGTISQNELEALAADLQADYKHLKEKLIGEDNPDGTVSRDALMDWFYNDHSNSQMRMVFDRMDADSSGFIEKVEIPSVLKLCAENISEENVDIAMSTLDRDGDMKISFDEFAHWFNNDCKLVTYRSFFSLYASTGDGEDRIGLPELEEVLIAMGGKKEHIKVQETMDKIDKNKNGFVELEEFIAWAVAHN